MTRLDSADVLPLAGREFPFSGGAIARTAVAASELAHAAAAMPASEAPITRVLLRAEALASSYLDGVTAPLMDVLLAEEFDTGGDTAAGAIAANLAVLADAVASARDANPVTARMVIAWHRDLQASGPSGPAQDLPEGDLVDRLDDVVAYANRADVDPVAQAAIVHAQLELLAPFGDVTGRVGRVLSSWVLTRRLDLRTPPPLSSRIAADVGGYRAGLEQFRGGNHDAWVRWFADRVTGAADLQKRLIRDVARLQERWYKRLARPSHGRPVRSDSSSWAILELVPSELVLSSYRVAELTGQSWRGASKSLGVLVQLGVLTAHDVPGERTRGRPGVLYVSEELLALSDANPRR